MLDWSASSASGSGLRFRQLGEVGGHPLPRASAEDEDVEQRVRPEPVRSVDRDAGHLARGVEAGHDHLSLVARTRPSMSVGMPPMA
jgi:hypothetical protein